MSGPAEPGDGGAAVSLADEYRHGMPESILRTWAHDAAVELREVAALRASNAEMLAALRKALLILTETFRWHRSTQSDAGRTIDAYNAMEAARAAIARATEAAS